MIIHGIIFVASGFCMLEYQLFANIFVNHYLTYTMGYQNGIYNEFMRL